VSQASPPIAQDPDVLSVVQQEVGVLAADIPRCTHDGDHPAALGYGRTAAENKYRPRLAVKSIDSKRALKGFQSWREPDGDRCKPSSFPCHGSLLAFGWVGVAAQRGAAIGFTQG
jgi:hypothetical protein